MGKVKDFIAKWKSIDRPEWNLEKDPSMLRYKREITDAEVDAVVEKDEIDREDAGNELSVVYDGNEESFDVYAQFEDSDTKDKIHYESFEHRKDAKDRLGELIDEYTEIGDQEYS